MRTYAVGRDELDAGRVAGRVLCQDLKADAGRGFAKGTILAAEDVPRLAALPWRELHVAELEPGEVHEDAAGERLARAAAGDGVAVGEAGAGAWPLSAARRGLVAIAVDDLRRVNAVAGMCVYTLYDGQVVDAGDAVARAKITPFAVPASRLAEAEGLARAAGGLVRVRAFRPTRVGAVVQETLGERAVARFREAFAEKVRWFGSELLDPLFVPPDAGAVAEGVARMAERGAEVIALAGTKAMDDLDPTFVALDRLGVPLERHGVPAHPGSLLWVARYRDIPLVGMPSCGLFSQASTLDLVLPRLLAGDRVGDAELAELGHGGLLGRDSAWRFPPYRGRGAERGAVDA